MMTRRGFITATSVAVGVAAAQDHALRAVSREKLKITDIKVTLLSYELPKSKQWYTKNMVCWKTDAVLVQVFTDKGIIGIGESSPYGGSQLVKSFIEEEIRPRLIGKNPFDVENLTWAWGSVPYRNGSVEERGNGSQVGWAGVDGACWDIIGKAKNVPVYKLLAGADQANPHIRVYASGGVGYAWYKRPEVLIEEAARHKENGYTAFKFRIGTEWKNSGITVQKYIPWVRKVREAVGPKFDLMQDANMRLTLDQCLELAPVYKDLGFHWFEEPFPRTAAKSFEGHARLKQALAPVRISGGENLVSRLDFKEWADRAYDIIQPDCNVVGVSEAWYIARMAHLQEKICCPHNWHGGLTTMMNAALVAGIPNRDMLELNQTFNPLKEEVFKEPLVVKNGYMDLPNKPGFGVELAGSAEQLARKFPYLEEYYYRENTELPTV
jgi:L-alanine-DL-glutamate epimerase-like enolase superfamily enzyme